MAKRKKYAKSPLLYIHQPDISSPKAPMQSNYATPKKEKQVEPTAPNAQKSNARPLKRDNYFKRALEAKTEAPPEKKSVEPESKSKDPKETKAQIEEPSVKPESNRKFNDMTVSEKVDYFLSKPDHIPSMKCEVKTEERSYRGSIINVEEDQVLMRVGRRTSTTKIAIESIIDIRLIGF